jgi:hypothetical protein
MTGKVLTQHNDTFRSGAILTEATLTISNVNAVQFGKLCTRFVDGDIYAQPLYMRGVNIPGRGTRDVVYVVTMKNNVYAFDAHDYSVDPHAGLLWSRTDLGPPEQGRIDVDGNSPPYASCPSAAYYGITSTPVIDETNDWPYLVVKTVDASRQFHQYLYRLDVRNGRNAHPGSGNKPTEINASAMNSSNAAVIFDPSQLNRASLLLANRRIYIAFAGHCDFGLRGPYHGWVLAYDAVSLSQIAAFNTTLDDAAGGVWQSGNGLASDDKGNVYFQTGNRQGPASGHRNPTDYSEAIVRLSADLTDPTFFLPPNYQHLDAEDLDLGSSGPLLIPEAGSEDLIGGGKSGRLYLLNRGSMSVKQTFKATVNVSNAGLAPERCAYGPDHYGPFTSNPSGKGETLCPHIHSGLVYWRGPEADTAWLYVWGERDYLRAYRYDLKRAAIVDDGGVPFPMDDTGLASSAPSKSHVGAVLTPLHDPDDHSRVMPGPTLSLSANGNLAGSGIIWATQTLRDNAEYRNVFGVLHAFDATTLRELWNSGPDQFGRDFLGRFAKYAAPTIAGGSVFVPTFSDQLVVYGLKSRAAAGNAPWQRWSAVTDPWPSPAHPGDYPAPPAPLPVNASLTVLARNPGTLDLYAVHSDGSVGNVGWWGSGDQWHAGYTIGGPGFAPAGAPLTAIARTPDVVDLYVARGDGSVWNASWWGANTNNGRWNAGYPVSSAGFTKAGAPISAIARHPTVVDLYAVRNDGAVWNAGWWAEDVNSGRWNPGYPVSAPGFASSGAPVSVIARTADIVDLYVVRTDGSVWNAGWWAANTNDGKWNPAMRSLLPDSHPLGHTYL